MGRSSLVFASLVLSAASAHASTEPVCSCATAPVILPAAGARDVPRNTKIWVVGGAIGQSRLESNGASWAVDGTYVMQDGPTVYRFDFEPLAEARRYSLQDAGQWEATQFTTGSRDDTTPPAPPVVRTFTMAVSEYESLSAPVTELGFDAALDPDVALLHFVFTSAEVRWSVVTTTDSWRWLGRPACRTQLPFIHAGDHVSVAISAIDLAGNESTPAVREIVVERAPPTLPACAQARHWRCGTGDMALVFFTAIGGMVGFIIFLAVWLGRHFRRVRERQLAMPRPISLLVAERLARAMQRRAGVFATVGVVGVPALVVMGMGPLAIISTVVGCVGLRGFFLARAVLLLIERGGERVVAEAQGPTVIVRSTADEAGGEARDEARDEARIDVTLEALARALRHAVPTSIAKRS